MALKYLGTVAVTHEPPSPHRVRRQVARGLKSGNAVYPAVG